MKKILSSLTLLLLVSAANSQLTIQSGATLFIQTGGVVTVQGDVVTNADIQGPGTLLMKGAVAQTLYANGFTIPNLQIDNTNNVSLGSAATIANSLVFASGKFVLGGSNLTLATAATISGFDNTKYVITNGTGRLVKNSLGATPFTYPVGFDGATYNPLTLIQNGTVDNIGVKVNQNVLANGSGGSPFLKEVIDAEWDVSEGTAGGSNLNMTASWNGTDELPGFNRLKTGISFWDGVGWDMTNAMTGAAAGAGPYTVTRNGIANLGMFAVGTRPVLISLLVSPKVFLQGAYAGGGLMSDGLRAAGVIPLIEPYTGISAFTHSGSGGGERVPSTILTSTGTGSDIVDWAFAELRNGTTNAVITTRAVLIQRDGNLVDVDGTNTKVGFINFAGEVAGSYYVALRHRNHLGVRTAGNLALSRTLTTNYNFTTSASQALSSVQASLTGGVFGMYGGNANSNTTVRYTGPSALNDNFALLNTILGGVKTNILSGVYSVGDLNMNGSVRYTGPSALNDNFFLLNTVLGGIKTTIITQPF
jgi:hypothetical protein